MGGMALLLEREARARGLFTGEEALTPASAFNLVRDMPYRRASTRRPQSIIEEWRGTCSGKHYLLDEIFGELGLESVVRMCTHEFSMNNAGHFPTELRELLAAGPVPDVHTFLRVRAGQGWMTVDATWPSSAESLGMAVNHRFIPGVDMALACDPYDSFAVPAGQDPQQFKEELLEKFCGTHSQRRNDFIEGMGKWLGERT